MLKQILQLNRSYQDAKEKAVEQTVNVIESKTNPWLALLFLSLTISAWLMAKFIPGGLENLYNTYGFYPIVVFLLISYFTLFIGSKFIFKPTAEESSDDTSLFAIFSACRRKESRSFISIGMSVLNTLLFVLYLISKDMKQH